MNAPALVFERNIAEKWCAARHIPDRNILGKRTNKKILKKQNLKFLLLSEMQDSCCTRRHHHEASLASQTQKIIRTLPKAYPNFSPPLGQGQLH